MSVVSIVTPVFNGEKFIDACIDSVQAQTFTDWEMLVVDDGSTDETFGLIQARAAQDPRIRLLTHPGHQNQGVSKSRQLGISQCCGKYVSMLDADDLFKPTKLERQVSVAQRHAECVVFHGRGVCVDQNGNKKPSPNLADSFNRFATHDHVYDFCQHERFLVQNPILNSSALIRRDALSATAYGFEQLFQYEDWTLWVLLAQKGSFYVSAEDLVCYRVHDESASALVMESSLVETYSYIEFLLSVIALCQGQNIRERAAGLLEAKLADAVKGYAADGEVVLSSVPLKKVASDSLAQEAAAALPKPKAKRRWFQAFSLERN